MAVAYFVCLVTTFFGLSFTLHSYYALGYSLRSARYLLFNYVSFLVMEGNLERFGVSKGFLVLKRNLEGVSVCTR